MIVSSRMAFECPQISNQFDDDEFFLKLPLNLNLLTFVLFR